MFAEKIKNEIRLGIFEAKTDRYLPKDKLEEINPDIIGWIKIENTKINLTKIFNEYEELTGNYLDLITFIEEYKEHRLSLR